MGDRSPRFGAFSKRTSRTEFQMDRILARNYTKKSHLMPLVALAAMGASLSPSVAVGAEAKKVGVGQDCCDTSWVQNLVERARSCNTTANTPPGVPIPTCGPGSARPTQIAFPAGQATAAGASGQAQLNVQVANFMGRRLLVPGSIAADFVIDDVKVGTKSVFDSEDPIPAEMFSTSAENAGSYLAFIPATAGILITVYFTSVRASGTSVFRAVIEGAEW